MHCTYRQTLGTEIIEEQNHETIGIVTDLLMDSDRGIVLGLIVQTVLEAEPQIMLALDILSWGKRIHIRSIDVLGPLAENIRLQKVLDDERTIIGQKIMTKSGTLVGACYDVQFDAKTLTIEWLFPRRFCRRKVALPASEILEITKKAIVVRDQMPKEEQRVEEMEIKSGTTIDPLAAPTPGMGRNR